MIDVHHVHSPNGQKVAILLEELGLPYRLLQYSIFEGRQLEPEFRLINPNNRLPAIVDGDPDDGGPPFAVFDSGAILLYLAEKTGRFLPLEARARSVVVQWLMWQMSGLGPMQGQAQHFVRYAPDSIPYAVTRYRNECLRLMDVMEYRLGESEYLGGDEYSIADIATWPWVRSGRIIGLDIGDRPNVARWYGRVGERPAVIRGSTVPAGHALAGPPLQKVELTPEQWSNLFGDNLLAAAKAIPPAAEPLAASPGEGYA
ncbi:MAG: yfcG [Bradyrhizobium sp.]|nr:yfcG [Bradyrhizobium sp.]